MIEDRFILVKWMLLHTSAFWGIFNLNKMHRQKNTWHIQLNIESDNYNDVQRWCTFCAWYKQASLWSYFRIIILFKRNPSRLMKECVLKYTHHHATTYVMRYNEMWIQQTINLVIFVVLMQLNDFIVVIFNTFSLWLMYHES